MRAQSLAALVHLYDPAKADLARQGKEAVDSLDFSTFVAAEDKNIAFYQQEETKAWHENVRLTRDYEISRLAVSPLPFERAWLGPDGQLGKHLVEVFGTEEIRLDQLTQKSQEASKSQTEFESAQDGIRERREYLSDLGFSAPSCDPSLGAPVTPRTPEVTERIKNQLEQRGLISDLGDAISAYDHIVVLCAESEKAFQQLADLTPKLSDFNSEIVAEREQLANYEAEQRAIGVKFDEVVAQIEAATPNAGDKKPSQLAGPALEALRGVTSKGAEFVGSEETLELSKRRLARIDAVLLAAASGELEDPNLNDNRRRLAVALGGLPDLADSFYDLAAASDEVPRLALIVVREQVRAQRDLAAADLARRRGKSRIKQERLTTLVWELEQYSKSVRLIKEAEDRGAPDLLERRPVELVSSSTSAPVRERVKAAVAWSMYVWSTTEGRLVDLEAASHALEYDSKLARSRVALAEWKGMLAALADGQVGYHEAGIKPEELSALAIQLLQAAGLFTIAAEVN